MDVLEKISDLLEKRKWSVYKLAKVGDIPTSTLSNMFNKSTCPTIATLELICKALDISLSEFFAEEESTDQLSPREQLLIQAWRAQTEQRKQAIFELLNIENQPLGE